MDWYSLGPCERGDDPNIYAFDNLLKINRSHLKVLIEMAYSVVSQK